MICTASCRTQKPLPTRPCCEKDGPDKERVATSREAAGHSSTAPAVGLVDGDAGVARLQDGQQRRLVQHRVRAQHENLIIHIGLCLSPGIKGVLADKACYVLASRLSPSEETPERYAPHACWASTQACMWRSRVLHAGSTPQQGQAQLKPKGAPCRWASCTARRSCWTGRARRG